MYSSVLKGLADSQVRREQRVRGPVVKAAGAKVLAHSAADRVRARGDTGEVQICPGTVPLLKEEFGIDFECIGEPLKNFKQKDMDRSTFEQIALAISVFTN